jgi:hypothetical protein
MATAWTKKARSHSRRLRELDEIGLIDIYCAQNAQRVANRPEEPCILCEGNGQCEGSLADAWATYPDRHKIFGDPELDPADFDADGIARWTCMQCGGTGRCRLDEYPLLAETVARFRGFLEACGGFQIW